MDRSGYKNKPPSPRQPRKHKKKSKKQLPNKIIPIDNVDKAYQKKDKWFKGRNPLNIPNFRAIIWGPPDSGKSTLVKNILLRADPPFVKLYVVHCDPDYTNEYVDVDGEMLTEVPDPTDSKLFDGTKTLLVFDDIEFKYLPGESKRRIDRLFGFASSHKNLSIAYCVQDGFNIVPTVRRMANLWVIYKIDDIDALSTIARRTGFKKKDFEYLFNNFVKGKHYFIMIDKTNDTPYPLRLNGFIMLGKTNGFDKK